MTHGRAGDCRCRRNYALALPSGSNHRNDQKVTQDDTRKSGPLSGVGANDGSRHRKRKPSDDVGPTREAGNSVPLLRVVLLPFQLPPSGRRGQNRRTEPLALRSSPLMAAAGDGRRRRRPRRGPPPPTPPGRGPGRRRRPRRHFFRAAIAPMAGGASFGATSGAGIDSSLSTAASASLFAPSASRKAATR